ncbi:MAG: hypothetical protein GY820_38820 [Gammaproteobacteria bacterium]|nr:hypothetical protein [Gammaproteobacteria bacterium]
MAVGLGTMALVKGGGEVAKWAWNKWGNQPKSFEDTSYGQRLQEIANRGKYTPGMKSNIVGGVSRAAGGIASQARTQLRGNMIHRGMEGSIAGERGAGDINTAYMDRVSDTARAVEFANEQSKVDAKNEYARAKGGYQDRIDQFNQANNASLVGGLVDTGVGYVGGKIQQNMKFGDLPLTDRIDYRLKVSDAITDRKRVNNYSDKINAQNQPDNNYPDISGWNSSDGLNYLEEMSKDQNAFMSRLQWIEQNNPELFQQIAPYFMRGK